MKTEIAEYSPVASALAGLRQKYENAVFDTSTAAGMAKAIAARRELREVRVNLEKLRKELKAPALERSRLIDAEAKTLTAQIEEMEAPIDSQIKAEEARKAEEKAERERIEREKLEALHRRVAEIRAIPSRCVGWTSAAIQKHRDELLAIELTMDFFGALIGDAFAAKAESLSTLADMYAAAVAQESEAERLRMEREQLEAQRKAQEEQARKEREELAKLRAEQAERERAAQAAVEKQMEEERARIAAERAEIAKAQAEKDAKAKAIRDAEQAEIDRQRAELEEQQRKVEAERVAQEEAASKLQSGYEALQSFVDRFGGDTEFKTIAGQIRKWLDGKKEQSA